ncbi:hypothetical protein BIU82_09425 [Arthrobacter sp. SW1]|uniref:YdcF family protein n=1 Tax=Arthrobacter sp. SW1 TaxID=1920889 RepID=UPI000877C7E6|nr:ElyC/SanA/YdcF family protein [Arthrobacter sp. SW1]OFI37294.1 hypothetical protein BIU82_09425 [Arthrobacter sp. SW1]
MKKNVSFKRFRRRRILAWFLAVLLAWGLAGIPLFVVPASDEPLPADVVFVLGPPSARVEYAEQLMLQGAADTIAISMPLSENGRIEGAYCEAKRHYKILCFHPEPFTTEGEALELAAMAEKYGWKSANIVAPTFHVTRAGWIIRRCFPGTVRMIGYDEGLNVFEWAYQYAYQSAALVKAAFQSDC